MIDKSLNEAKNNDEESSSMSLIEHLEELRKILFKIIIYILVCFVIIFVFKDFVFSKIILAPREPWFFTNSFLLKLSQALNIKEIAINTSPLKLINVTLAGQFSAHLLVSLIGAIIVSFPLILRQIWLYISPALYPHEKKSIRSFVGVCSFLFIVGIAFGYYIIVPLSVNFLGNYQVSESVENTVTLMSYVSAVSVLTLAMGLVFQLPILILSLSRMNIVSASFLRKNRKIAFIIIMIISAIITPPDFFSLLLVTIPLYSLYEICIRIIKDK